MIFLLYQICLVGLVQYSKVFDKNNKEIWPHYVSNEDYAKVYALNSPHKENFEQLYSIGRDCAIALSTRLIEFNDVNIRPHTYIFYRIFGKMDGFMKVIS